MKDRSVQRGKPLLDMCYKAKRTTHEYGENDDRVYCFGIGNRMTDCVYEECSKCGAYVFNAEPIRESEDA